LTRRESRREGERKKKKGGRGKRRKKKGAKALLSVFTLCSFARCQRKEKGEGGGEANLEEGKRGKRKKSADQDISPSTQLSLPLCIGCGLLLVKKGKRKRREGTT